MKIVTYLSDELAIRRVLDELGMSPPAAKPPPPIPAVARVPLDDDGREILVTR